MDDKSSGDLASRIEKTLADREQERMKEPSSSIESTDLERSGRRAASFNYMMLLLGVLLGAVAGATVYFFLPVSTSLSPTSLPQVEPVQGLAEADRLLAAGQDLPAKKAYLAVISDGSSSPRPYNNLASLYAAEGDLEQAQVLLKKALETNPDYLTVYHNVGMVYAAMARDSYGKALQLTGETKPLRLQPLGVMLDGPLVAKEILAPQEVLPSAITVVAKVKKPEAEVVEPTTKTEFKQSAQASSDMPKLTTPVVLTKEETPAGVEKQTNNFSIVSLAPAKGAAPLLVAESIVSQAMAISDPSASVSTQQFLQQWAYAWSSQDIAAYLLNYAPDYVPAGNLSRDAWQAQRRKRLKAPSFIEVGIESINLISETADTSVVEAIQSYRSDRYQDRTRKSFVLRRRGQTWVIVDERSLGRVR